MKKSTEALSIINTIVRESCKIYTSCLELYWPGWNNNDASEKLFQQQVAILLHGNGWLLYPEVTFGDNRRVDLVALHKEDKILLCIESKRVYSSTLKGICEDIEKIKSFKINKEEIDFEPEHTIGLILGSLWAVDKMADPKYAIEWGDQKLDNRDSRSKRLKRSKYWEKIVSLSVKHETISGSVLVTKDLEDYFSGWAKWIAFDIIPKKK